MRFLWVLFAWATLCAQETRYFVVFLRPDPARQTLSKEDGERLQNAHLANIHRMADNGVLVAAGPFDDTTRAISGIFVMKAESREKAQAIAAQDPTVLAHRNTVDAHAWMGPPGIGEEYFRMHKGDTNAPDKMQVHPLAVVFRGKDWDQRGDVMGAHGEYIGRLRGEGKLGAAGRVEGPDDLAGIVIFKVMPVEEAQRLMDDDPAAKAGVLRMEMHRWWTADGVLPW